MIELKDDKARISLKALRMPLIASENDNEIRVLFAIQNMRPKRSDFEKSRILTPCARTLSPQTVRIESDRLIGSNPKEFSRTASHCFAMLRSSFAPLCSAKLR